LLLHLGELEKKGTKGCGYERQGTQVPNSPCSTTIASKLATNLRKAFFAPPWFTIKPSMVLATSGTALLPQWALPNPAGGGEVSLDHPSMNPPWQGRASRPSSGL
jgi:hypothetical protein